jgi:hypothetical protein
VHAFGDVVAIKITAAETVPDNVCGIRRPTRRLGLPNAPGQAA